MKCIIAGASGVVGRTIVQHCLKNDKITHIFALSRKPLPSELVSSPKITGIQHQDFSDWTPELLRKLSGAQGCIWALGGSVTELGGQYEVARKISVDYPVAAAKAFIEHLGPQLPKGQKFRFVYCSMRFAEWDQSKTLWFYSDSRRIKGLAEEALIGLEGKNRDRMDLYCVRPYGVVPLDATGTRKAVSHFVNFVTAEQCGAAFAHVLLSGYRDFFIEHDDMLKIARDEEV